MGEEACPGDGVGSAVPARPEAGDAAKTNQVGQIAGGGRFGGLGDDAVFPGVQSACCDLKLVL